PGRRRSTRSRRGTRRTTPPARERPRSRCATGRGPRRPGARRSRLQLALLGRRVEHVVEDQPVARGMRMQRQVARWIADLVLLVLRVVATEERPRTLPMVAVDVLH